ncbi:MAG: glycosyltransferase family 4 protein [Anaerolineales bacterium]
MKRWLILTQYYPPEIGAPQIRLRSLARELRLRGIEVEILTAMPNYPAGRCFPGYKGRLYMREEIDGIPIRRTWIYAGAGRSASIRLLNYLSFTFSAMMAALIGPRPDVLFVESQPLSLGFVAILMKWLRGVPYIYNVPDLQIDVARQLGFMRNEVLLRIAWQLEDLFLRHSWMISTVTNQFIEHFVARGIPRDQITFLPNGADETFLSPQPASQELLQRWGLSGKNCFLYVGTHAYYHGLDTLIEAADLLRKRTEIAFLFIGDGPEKQRLQEAANDLELDNVIFGESPYEEMDQLYSIAIASIATIRKMDVASGMRLSKIFPSLSCGVPVIFSGVGETADLLLTNECGIAVPPEDPVRLSDAILELASDPSKRNQMGEHGRSLVEAEYSWQAIVGRWLEQAGIPHMIAA